jgi:prolipoprotein diacylglyceryltransferase
MNRTNEAPSPVEYVQIKKSDLPPGQNSRMPIDITILFKQGIDEDNARAYLNNEVKFYLTRLNEFVDEPATAPMNYQLVKGADNLYGAKIQTFGIARHPAQMYESISCFILFAFLFWYWSRYKINLPEGRIFGMFMIALWSLRFLYEFLKENQVDFENQMKLNMGQLLSIPLIIVGIWVLVRSYKKPATEIQGTP